MAELRPWLALLAARRGRLALGLLLMLVTVSAAIALLGLAGWFITATAVAAAAGLALDVYVPGAGIRTFALVRTGARYAERVYNHDTVLRLLADLRATVFARLARLDPAALGRLRSADVLTRLTADIDALDNLYLRVAGPPLVALAAIAAVGALLAVLAPAAALPVVGLLLLTGALALCAGGRAGAGPGGRVAVRAEALRQRLVDMAQGLGELSAFGALAGHRARTSAVAARLVADQARLARRAALGEAATTAGVHLAAVLALGIGVVLFHAGGIGGPVLVLLPLAVLGLGEALGAVPGAFVQLGHTRAAARRLERQLAAPVADAPADASAPVAADLAVERVTFRHAPAADPVLDGASLTLDAGASVAVVGASGAGKSTLADLCAGLLVPERGCVRLGGVAVAGMAPGARCRHLACLTQRTELFDDSVGANLRLARPHADDAALWAALAVAGLDAFVGALPEGLETPVGESGVRLSGGQARRLALARVVLADTPVVLLDEPLAGLDRATAADVAGRLQAWLAGRTVVLLAHAPEALPRAHRVLRVEQGRLVDPATAAG